MKKFGIIMFIVSLVVGLSIAKAFSFGNADSRFFNFQFNFGRVKGSGNVINEKRDITGFDAIEVHGAMEVEVVSQSDFSVEVTGDDNLLQYIRTDVRGSRLDISSEKSYSTKSRIKIRIGAPNVEVLDLSGASVATLSNVKTNKLLLESSGASKITVSGEVRDLIIDLSGASKVSANDLKAVNVRVEGSGASSASVFATGELRADLSGASHVNYSGNPTNVFKDVSGASSVSSNQ